MNLFIHVCGCHVTHAHVSVVLISLTATVYYEGITPEMAMHGGVSSLSLKDRVFRSTKYSSSISVPLGATSVRAGTYRIWTQQQMDRAVYEVVNEGSSIRRAALQCGVPKSSLGDRISGRVVVDATSGPSTYLSPRDEEELVTFLTRCASIGYAKSRKEVLAVF